MNGVALFDLVSALAPLMPSEAAAPHASLEWRHARKQWLAAINELRMSEETIREMAGRLIALNADRGAMQ